MNGSFLFLSAVVALGADTPPPSTPAPLTPVPVATAPITVSGTGCGGCGAPVSGWGGAPVAAWGACDPCAPRMGLFARLRARFDRPQASGWDACAPACDPCAVAAPVVYAPAPAPAPAPVASCGCGQPLFTGFTTSCSDPCERVGLLARLRARFAGGRSCDALAAPLACGSCASSVVGFPSPGCTSSFGTVLTPSVAPTTPGATTPPDTTPVPMPMDPKKDEPKGNLSIGAPAQIPAVDVPRVPTLGGTSGKY